MKFLETPHITKIHETSQGAFTYFNPLFKNKKIEKKFNDWLIKVYGNYGKVLLSILKDKIYIYYYDKFDEVEQGGEIFTKDKIPEELHVIFDNETFYTNPTPSRFLIEKHYKLSDRHKIYLQKMYKQYKKYCEVGSCHIRRSEATSFIPVKIYNYYYKGNILIASFSPRTIDSEDYDDLDEEFTE